METEFVKRLQMFGIIAGAAVITTIVAIITSGIVKIAMGALTIILIVILTSVGITCFKQMGNQCIKAQQETIELRARQADLQRELKERSEQALQLQMVTDVLRAVASAHDVSDVARTLLEEAIQMFGAETGRVFLLSDDGQHLEEVATYPIPDRHYEPMRVSIGKGRGLIADVATTGRAVLLPDASNKHDKMSGPSSMCVPLTSPQGTQGVLLLEDSKRRFTQRDLRALELLAQQASLALERARLYRQMERLSLTDALTGIANRRHLERHLRLELSRAQRYQYPVAAILLDIDHFKNFNDTYGHLTGDKVLQDLAGLITSIVRASDFVGRYGGEEFMIVGAYTDLEGGVYLAERVRRAVEQTTFESHNGEPLHITISAGVAVFPDDAQTERELIEAADKALYEAKQTGRNKVCVYKR